MEFLFLLRSPYNHILWRPGCHCIMWFWWVQKHRHFILIFWMILMGTINVHFTEKNCSIFYKVWLLFTLIENWSFKFAWVDNTIVMQWFIIYCQPSRYFEEMETCTGNMENLKTSDMEQGNMAINFLWTMWTREHGIVNDMNLTKCFRKTKSQIDLHWLFFFFNLFGAFAHVRIYLQLHFPLVTTEA